MRLLATDLRLNERAEAYLRFPAGAQNLLTYRTLRVWMRGRGPGWAEGDLQAYIKAGSDNDNFYLYRAPAKTDTWLPEFVVDLEVWRRLRTEVENRWLSGQGPSGAAECGASDSTAYVACDGPYLVNVHDPGVNPPNLAAVQEIAAGIYRTAAAVTSTQFELWVDDIRLSDPVSRTGTAASVDARLALSDVGNVAVAYIRQNGQFRQLNENPSYRQNVLQLASELRLDRFLPASLGFAIPLSLTHARTSVNPGAAHRNRHSGRRELAGFRKPVSHSTTANLIVRRAEPGTNWITRGLLDPLSFAGTYTSGQDLTELSEANSSAYTFNLNYLLAMRRKSMRLPIGGLAGLLPGFMRRGEAGQEPGPRQPEPDPDQHPHEQRPQPPGERSHRVPTPHAQSTDAAEIPTLSLNHLWRNSAGLSWQPLGMLNTSADLTSTRDLRVYPDSSSLGRLAYAERRFLLGVPVGVERDRSLVTTIALTPTVASWLRPRLLTSSNFVLSRTLTSRSPVRADEDSGAFILPQTLNNSRFNELGSSVDLARGLRLLVGDSSTLGRALLRVRPVDLSTRITHTSTYDLTAFDPSAGYQLGLGGLGDFLSQNGTPARGVSEARVATLAGGADLPYGVTVTLSHALTRTTRFSRSPMGSSRPRPISGSGRSGVSAGAIPSPPARSAFCPSAPPSAGGKGAHSRSAPAATRP